MWLVVGDTHGLSSLDSYKIRPTKLKQDYDIEQIEGLIICGDFGGIWDGEDISKSEKKELDNLNTFGYPIYFLDGNHENHPQIAKYPIIERFGGKMHEIRPNVHHLMRGEVYNIKGKKIFVMGGATSIDKLWRVEGISWWAEEIPSKEEWENAYNNLDKVDWKVDYVLTHCVPSDWLTYLFTIKKEDVVTNNLQGILERLEYNRWYCGHYHTDVEVNEVKLTVLYDKVRILIE